MATPIPPQPSPSSAPTSRVSTKSMDSATPRRRRDDPLRDYRELIDLIAFRRAPRADATAERAVAALPALADIIDRTIDTYLAALSTGLNHERDRNDVLQAENGNLTRHIQRLEREILALRAK